MKLDMHNKINELKIDKTNTQHIHNVNMIEFEKKKKISLVFQQAIASKQHTN